MTEAQRRRDGALRRLRLANRAGVVASIAGAVAVMWLAHRATPVGTSGRVAIETVKRTANSSDAGTRQVTPSRPAAQRKIRPADSQPSAIAPAAAPKAVVSTPTAPVTSGGS